MFDMTSTCLPRFLITEYFSVEKTQYRFPLIASYLPLPGQYKRDSSLLDRTLSQKFDDWGRFRRTFSQITRTIIDHLVNELKGGPMIHRKVGMCTEGWKSGLRLQAMPPPLRLLPSLTGQSSNPP